MLTPQEIRNQADAADERLKEGRAGLYRPDRTPLYSEAEHAERTEALEKEWSGTLSALAQKATEERVKAETEVLENGDLSATLSPDELANASGRYIFISEEVMEMNREKLLSRLSGLAAGSDRASMFAHARATRKRASKEYQERLEAAKKSGRSYAAKPEDLEEAAQRLEDALTGGARKRKIEDAKKRADEYLGAEVNIGARRSRRKSNLTRRVGVRRVG